MVKTVLDILETGTEFLEKKSIPEARLQMQWLAAETLNCSRLDLYLNYDRPVTEEELTQLRKWIKLRSENVPLQHLIGKVEFFGSTFFSDSRALIPRPETEELVELITREFSPGSEPERILDVGCGSGVIGLSLAKFWPSSTVVLADLSPDALALAQKNAAHLNLTNVEFIESNLFQNIEGRFDLITANLPYISTEEQATMDLEVLKDPHLALFSGKDGLDLIRIFCEELNDHLYQDALVAMEVGYDQGAIVGELLEEKAQLTSVKVHSDLSKIQRFPFAYKK